MSRTTSVSDVPQSATEVVRGNGGGGDGGTMEQRQEKKEGKDKERPLVSVNIEALIHDVKRRGAQKGRNADEVEAMAQTAARYVAPFSFPHNLTSRPISDAALGVM